MLKTTLKLLHAFWLIAPAYAANAFPPLLRGKRPLDFGKYLGKNRVLGDGKTIEGTIGGAAFGVLIGVLQSYATDHLPTELMLPKLALDFILLLSLGAILGDIAGSFFKRRLGIPRGKSTPLLDQLDFLVGAILLSSLVYKWDLLTIAFLLLVTPLIHLLANSFAFLLKVKRVPY